MQTLKAKKTEGSSDDGSWDASPYGTLTRSAGGSSTGADSNKSYRTNPRAKLPSIFNPFIKVIHQLCVVTAMSVVLDWNDQAVMGVITQK